MRRRAISATWLVTALELIHRGHRDHAEFVIRQGRSLGGESIDGAAVLDNAMAVELRNVEADAESRLLARLSELRGPHLFESRGLQNATVRTLALVEKDTQEAAKIKDGGNTCIRPGPFRVQTWAPGTEARRTNHM